LKVHLNDDFQFRQDEVGQNSFFAAPRSKISKAFGDYTLKVLLTVGQGQPGCYLNIVKLVRFGMLTLKIMAISVFYDDYIGAN
jgi:hypothetical protein